MVTNVDALGIGSVTVVRISKEKYGVRSSVVIKKNDNRKLSTPNEKKKTSSQISTL